MYGTQSLSGFIQAAEVLTGRTVIPKNVFIMHCYLLGVTLLRALKTLNVMTTQEVDTVKITSHRNKKIYALQCFLIVKSFLSIVSQFALAGNTCGLKCPQQGREGTAGPCAGTAMPHWPWPWCWSTARGAHCARGKGAPGSSDLHPRLGQGRDWGK